MKRVIPSIRLAIAVGVALLGFAARGSADLITNGSFEIPNIGGGFAVFGSIPGWTTSFGPGIEIQHGVAGSPFDGLQHVELDSFAPSGMFQNLATSAGGKYNLSFRYSPRPGVADNKIQVFWDGALLDTLMASGVGNPDTVWTLRSYNVMASMSSTRLEFRDASVPDALGGYLDAVTAPEPGSFLMLAGGLPGLALVARWHRRRRERRG